MSKVIGIDLGTTFSAIASLDDMGNPEVLPSLDENRKITASAIYVNDKKVIVGDKALNFLANEPTKVITQTKREMENNMVYSLDEGKWVKNDGQIKDCYSPSQVSSLILKKLKDYTSDVKKAVITVPAMFAEEARQATLDAAKMAEIEVIELINEPTAAVLHYASLPGVEVGGRVMIYDLGGGTFDVTIAEVKNKKVDVITSRGDKYLGGKDFDAEIIKLFDKKYNNKNGANLDLDNKYFYQKAEEVKKILSVKDKTNININGPKGEMEIEVTRDEFEDSIQTYLEKTKMLIEEVMEASGMSPKRINQVLLVGGSTRIPAVVKSLTKLMGKPPVKGVNVDEAVVCGAAIYAGLKTEKKSLNEKQKEALSQVELTDVCNFYMGTLAHVTNPTTGREEIMNTIIINRDAKLPVAITKRYYTISENQTAIECSVTQSEGEENNREFVNIIHQGKLELPPNRPSNQPIDVTYSYDVSGKIHCLFTDTESGNKHEIELKPNSTKELDDTKKIVDEIVIE